MQPQADSDVQVLIVGAGPVGLALAIELGQRGVRVLLVEQNQRVGRQPRAETTNVRTMAHLRRWGIAEQVRDAAPLGRGYPTDVVFATRFFGRPLALVRNAFSGDQTLRDERFSEPAQWLPQYRLEAVLRDALPSLPSVELRMHTALESFIRHPDGVQATLVSRADGTSTTIRSRYLVGADGARSTVRKQLDIAMLGQRACGLHRNVVVRVPGLTAARELPRGIMYWLVNADSPATFSPMDHPDIWAYGYVVGQEPSEPSPEDISRRVVAAIGREMPIEILSVDVWAAHSLVAERYRVGPVFLAGDACHLHPPYGGYGMNLGVADAVDLGWKLAATLRGWGGPALLDSYQIERMKVHRRVIDEAMRNDAVLTKDLIRDHLEADGAEGEAVRAELGELIRQSKSREFHTLGVVLGYRYENSPIVVADGSRPPPEHVRDYVPSAHPGCLAPHLWLGQGDSLYDHFGPDYTLLVTGEADQADDILAAAAVLGIPLKLLRLTDPRLPALYEAPLALIRPDQHVAWRGGSQPFDAKSILLAVTGHADPPRPESLLAEALTTG